MRGVAALLILSLAVRETTLTHTATAARRTAPASSVRGIITLHGPRVGLTPGQQRQFCASLADATGVPPASCSVLAVFVSAADEQVDVAFEVAFGDIHAAKLYARKIGRLLEDGLTLPIAGVTRASLRSAPQIFLAGRPEPMGPDGEHAFTAEFVACVSILLLLFIIGACTAIFRFQALEWIEITARQRARRRRKFSSPVLTPRECQSSQSSPLPCGESSRAKSPAQLLSTDNISNIAASLQRAGHFDAQLDDPMYPVTYTNPRAEAEKPGKATLLLEESSSNIFIPELVQFSDSPDHYKLNLESVPLLSTPTNGGMYRTASIGPLERNGLPASTVYSSVGALDVTLNHPSSLQDNTLEREIVKQDDLTLSQRPGVHLEQIANREDVIRRSDQDGGIGLLPCPLYTLDENFSMVPPETRPPPQPLCHPKVTKRSAPVAHEVGLESEEALDCLALANDLQKAGHFDSSLEYYDKGLALALSSDLQSALLFNRSVAHGRLGSWETALQDINQSISLHPGWEPAISWKETCLGKNSRLTDRIEASPILMPPSSPSQHSPPPPTLQPVSLRRQYESPYGPIENGSALNLVQGGSPTGIRKDSFLRMMSILTDAEKFVDQKVARIQAVAIDHVTQETQISTDAACCQNSLVEEEEVEIQLTLDLDFSETVGREVTFGEMIRQDLARAIGGDVNKIRVLSLEAGSIVANVLLQKGLVTDGRSMTGLLKDLQNQLQSSASLLRSGEMTRFAVHVCLKNHKESYPELSALASPPASELSSSNVQQMCDVDFDSQNLSISPVRLLIPTHGESKWEMGARGRSLWQVKTDSVKRKLPEVDVEKGKAPRTQSSSYEEPVSIEERSWWLGGGATSDTGGSSGITGGFARLMRSSQRALSSLRSPSSPKFSGFKRSSDLRETLNQSISGASMIESSHLPDHQPRILSFQASVNEFSGLSAQAGFFKTENPDQRWEPHQASLSLPLTEQAHMWTKASNPSRPDDGNLQMPSKSRDVSVQIDGVNPRFRKARRKRDIWKVSKPTKGKEGEGIQTQDGGVLNALFGGMLNTEKAQELSTVLSSRSRSRSPPDGQENSFIDATNVADGPLPKRTGLVAATKAALESAMAARRAAKAALGAQPAATSTNSSAEAARRAANAAAANFWPIQEPLKGPGTFCVQCGVKLPFASRFCPSCGRPSKWSCVVAPIQGMPVSHDQPPTRSATPMVLSPTSISKSEGNEALLHDDQCATGVSPQRSAIDCTISAPQDETRRESTSLTWTDSKGWVGEIAKHSAQRPSSPALSPLPPGEDQKARRARERRNQFVDSERRDNLHKFEVNTPRGSTVWATGVIEKEVSNSPRVLGAAAPPSIARPSLEPYFIDIERKENSMRAVEIEKANREKFRITMLGGSTVMATSIAEKDIMKSPRAPTPPSIALKLTPRNSHKRTLIQDQQRIREIAEQVSIRKKATECAIIAAHAAASPPLDAKAMQEMRNSETLSAESAAAANEHGNKTDVTTPAQTQISATSVVLKGHDLELRLLGAGGKTDDGQKTAAGRRWVLLEEKDSAASMLSNEDSGSQRAMTSKGHSQIAASGVKTLKRPARTRDKIEAQNLHIRPDLLEELSAKIQTHRVEEDQQEEQKKVQDKAETWGRRTGGHSEAREDGKEKEARLQRLPNDSVTWGGSPLAVKKGKNIWEQRIAKEKQLKDEREQNRRQGDKTVALNEH